MKRTTLGVILGVLLFGVGSAHAQADPASYDPQNWFKKACPSCGVQGYVDYPKRGATLERNNIVLAGWGFECVAGSPITDVAIWYETDDGRGFLALKQANNTLHVASVDRPDVVRAFVPYCPNVSAMTGWWLQMSNPPPAGARRLLIQLRYGPYHADVIRTFNFIDP